MRLLVLYTLVASGLRCDECGPHLMDSVGKTTKSEVIAQYGEPDLVLNLAGQGGETATYRPVAVSPSIQVPTAQAGPLGTTTTQTRTIEPGLGGSDKAARRPQKEIRIRYDAQGIVQDVLQ